MGMVFKRLMHHEIINMIKISPPLNKNCFETEFPAEGELGSLKTEWLSTNEAAIYLRISVKSLRNLTSSGKIPHYKFFKLNRYRIDDLRKLLLSKKRGPIYGN